MTDDIDFYDLLDISSDASQDDVKQAFREQVRVYHPDLNDDDRAQAQFTALKKAYDILGDPVERQAYDRLGHEDYVAKRTSGLPSPDLWKSARDTDEDTDADADADESEGDDSSSSKSGSDSDSKSGSRSRSSTTSHTTKASASSATSAGGTTGSRTSSDSASAGAGSASTSTSSTSTGTGTGPAPGRIPARTRPPRVPARAGRHQAPPARRVPGPSRPRTLTLTLALNRVQVD
ncbi:DnaJ domain-containing protein [Saliphagus sp. GCM10025308]